MMKYSIQMAHHPSLQLCPCYNNTASDDAPFEYNLYCEC